MLSFKISNSRWGDTWLPQVLLQCKFQACRRADLGYSLECVADCMFSRWLHPMCSSSMCFYSLPSHPRLEKWDLCFLPLDLGNLVIASSKTVWREWHMTSEARSCNATHLCIAFLGHSHLELSLNAVKKPLWVHMEKPHVGVLIESLAEVPAHSHHEPSIREDASSLESPQKACICHLCFIFSNFLTYLNLWA